jgi:putative membrane protein
MKKTVTADTFFNDEEKKQIHQQIKDIEKHTGGEVAVMVVDRSDSYPEAEVMGGILLGSFLSLVISTLFFDASLWFFIPFSFLFHFPSRLVFRTFPVLKAAFIGATRMESAVMQRAVRAFYEKELYKTKYGTGVLFFLSLFERKVWVLADQGICEKIDQETLNRFAMNVSQGVKDGRACDALCESVREAGKLLAEHFPVTPGDIDELSDEVMTE